MLDPYEAAKPVIIRPKVDRYYLDIAADISKRSTCLRRRYGAVIVKNDEIIATGYNGAPRGRVNCTDHGYCIREQLQCEPGTRYELCRAVHAEQNAMLSAARKDMIGGTMYLCGYDLVTAKNMIVYQRTKSYKPCSICAMLLANSGLTEVVCIDEDGFIFRYKPIDLVDQHDKKLEIMAHELSLTQK